MKTTPDKLMALALDKFAHRVRNGKWKKTSEHTAKLLAMEARLEKIQMENRKLKADRRGRTRNQGNNRRNGGSQNEEKGEKGTKARERPEWMFKAPPESERTKAKKVGGKTYYWCGAAKVWGTHTATECRAGKDKHLGGETNTEKKKLRFNKALQAVAEDDSSASE